MLYKIQSSYKLCKSSFCFYYCIYAFIFLKHRQTEKSVTESRAMDGADEDWGYACEPQRFGSAQATGAGPRG
jgi:hypothetical protein